MPIIVGGLVLTKRVTKNGNPKMDQDHSDNSITEKKNINEPVGILRKPTVI